MRSPDQPLTYRNPEILSAILGALDQPEIDTDPLPWHELVHEFGEFGMKPKTVDRYIFELMRFGAVHKTGGGIRGTTKLPRYLQISQLGRAWLHSVPPPIPSPRRLLSPDGPTAWPAPDYHLEDEEDLEPVKVDEHRADEHEITEDDISDYLEGEDPY